mmetsp:Transcript_31021/g.65499  ORF Transcript_31021/g.65499 Transcript_31021/m.65499 type:complete len:229 (-) Transcript_31021:909-1595(-)|eukprot:CAMPEP_0172297662 /NCGR_PEP_ID=MMETSP1058-20130122/595_1 /TAXON_ID=83371 /ORGANISM="Detonula confervacea, Strain CCMP 353" /LENGTH=228 /DNA_ID=CAMNT_0013006835 /DNA_START=177 /DNA_END=863 /DNA_ORIENTATION=+
MTDPAPKVEAANASVAKPCAAPGDVDPGTASAVYPSFGGPSTERGSFVESAVKITTAAADQSQKLTSVETLRATQRVAFEAPAGVIIGPDEKSVCQKMVPCLFDERSFLSYGEIKRYVIIMDNNIFVYTDVTDPSPLYMIPLLDLVPKRDDPKHPDFYSYTISPEANTGLPFANTSKESLDHLLLRDRNGKIAFQFAFDKYEAGDDALEKFVSAVISSNEAAKNGKEP